MSSLERLIKAFQENPPTGARDRAYRLREVWLAYSKATRAALRKAHGNKPFYPELTVPTTIINISDFLLNQEAKGHDMSPCWAALDEGVTPTAVRGAITQAEMYRTTKPKVSFGTHLLTVFDDIAIRREKEGPPPSRPSAVAAPKREGLHLRYPDMTVRWIIAQSQLRRQPVDVYVLEALLRDADNAVSTVASTPAPAPVVPERRPAPAPAPAQRPFSPQRQATPKAASRAPTRKRPPKSTGTAKAKKNNGPVLRQKLRIVIGSATVTIPEVIQLLEARSWMPESRDPPAYMSMALSTNTDDFIRVKRGVYRVRTALDSAPPENVPVKPKSGEALDDSPAPFTATTH